MARGQTEIIGEKELIAKLGDLPRALTPRELRAALMSGAFIIANAAKQIVPVLTHTLQRSIHVEIEEDVAFIGTDVEYAAHVEYGTVKQSPQPYMRPAVDNHGQEAVKEVRDAAIDIIKRTAR
jgi:HK97 gp10 family phage protein